MFPAVWLIQNPDKIIALGVDGIAPTNEKYQLRKIYKDQPSYAPGQHR